MPKGKGKRTPPEAKLAALIKKQVKYRSDPSMCNNCRSCVEASTLGDDKLAAVGDSDLACVEHKSLVIFGVEADCTCDAWAKKRKKRGKKNSADGEEENGEMSSDENGDETAEENAEEKPKKKKKKKKKDK